MGGDLEQDLGRGGFRFTGYDRHAIIAALADFRENWDLSEERHTLPAGFVLPATVAEDFDALAAGRSEVCLLYTSPSPRDLSTSRMPSSA